MALLSDNTLWIFISAAPSNEVETHHINNIVKGIKSLEHNNIKPNNIVLLIDGDNTLVTNLLSELYPKWQDFYNLLTSQTLAKVIEESVHDNIVVFVTGHGYPYGIYGYTSDEFMTILTEKGNLNKNLIIYFGQCYSSVFYKTNARKSPKIAMFGVNTQKSPVYKLPHENLEYTIFLYWLFHWIYNVKNIANMNDRTVLASVEYAQIQTINSNNVAIDGNKNYIKQRMIELLNTVPNSHEYKTLINDIKENTEYTFINKINTWYNKEGINLAQQLKY